METTKSNLLAVLLGLVCVLTAIGCASAPDYSDVPAGGSTGGTTGNSDMQMKGHDEIKTGP